MAKDIKLFYYYIDMAPWEKFSNEKISKIFNEKKSVIDIGGGLRILKDRGNRHDESRKWIFDLMVKKGVDYKVLDSMPDYSPDIVGDIHNLPFPDNSQEAIVCLAVLEHVENPIKACQEMYRILKQGGYCFIYVPFLYYYHAEKGYYRDYWRFTKDSIDILFKDFSVVEKQNIRGAIATWLHLSPFGRVSFLAKAADLTDIIFKKINSNSPSGYSVFLIK